MLLQSYSGISLHELFEVSCVKYTKVVMRFTCYTYETERTRTLAWDINVLSDEIRHHWCRTGASPFNFHFCMFFISYEHHILQIKPFLAFTDTISGLEIRQKRWSFVFLDQILFRTITLKDKNKENESEAVLIMIWLISDKNWAVLNYKAILNHSSMIKTDKREECWKLPWQPSSE